MSTSVYPQNYCVVASVSGGDNLGRHSGPMDMYTVAGGGMSI